VPRNGYVSVTLRRDTWEKLQRLKLFLNATTYDELLDKLYRALVADSLSKKELENKLEEIYQQFQSLLKDLEKIYEIEKVIDSINSELENLKAQLSRLMARVELLEKRSSLRR